MLVEIQQVTLNLQGRNILENINLSVKRREIVTLVGPNGSGKSMLIRVLLGLIAPTSGRVSITKGCRIGYMPQHLVLEALMPLTVQKFLMLAPRATRDKAASLAHELNIEHILQTPVTAVSGGERQRTLLARALLNDPELLVLDEPTQGIDINGQAALYEYIAALRDRINCSIIMVSHDLHLVIAGTDQVICLNQHICCSGHPQVITKHPEFINIFGEQVASSLALYTHRHDHDHDH
jgi:zinc transport system ATP-binding protein